MRDGVILNGMGKLERNVIKDVRALHDLNVLCRTRIDAIERIMFGSRLGLVKVLFLSIFAPSYLQVLINEAHEATLNEYNDRTVKMAENLVTKARILEVK
jgi:hypothetical protein